MLPVVAVAAVALAFRLPRLGDRPMHGDEAIQAVQAWTLHTTGAWTYDPARYHGPVLAWISRPVLAASGARSFADTRERHYRLAPALCGAALAAAAFLFAGGLGWSAAGIAGALTAVSPACVFYSRYAIQEMPLVLLTALGVAAGWRSDRGRRRGWAYGCGVAVGLAAATKETWVLAAGAAAAGWLLTGSARTRREVLRPRVWAGPVVVAFGLAWWLLHAPFTALFAPVRYAGLAADGGMHRHPWSWYLHLLAWWHPGPGPAWSEAAILVLALGGVWAAWRADSTIPRRGVPLARWLAWSTLLLTVGYAAIPYKTPWCVLGFLHGLILLAGIGAAALLKRLGSRRRAAGVAALAAAVLHLGWQADRATSAFSSDPRNPWVYAHPVPDVIRLAELVERVAVRHPAGLHMRVNVIAPDDEIWPLPWYLRRLDRVGYWSAPPAVADAPVVIASPSLERAVASRLQDRYHPVFFGLRPAIVLTARIRADLWDEAVRSRP